MSSRCGSISGPLVLIIVGAIFLIHAISPDFQVGDLLSHYWPYALILWGVISFLEVCFRFMRGAPIPANGVSSGGWIIVVFVALVGLSAFEFQRPNTWWRQIGFNQSVEAFGQEHEYSVDPILKTVGSAPRIVLESFRGDAKITGVDGADVSLTGSKSIRSFESDSADRANKQTPVEISLEGNTVIVRCHQDRADSRSPVTTNLELSVPKGSSVEATGSVGDFEINTISGSVDINSGNSGVRLQDIGGDVKIDTRKSDVIRCASIKGTVDLHGRGSDVELEKIQGQVTVAGDYSGTVSLRALAKPVRVESMRTQLDVRQVPGEIRLDRGSLTGENLIGPIKVITKSTDVTLDRFTEGLELTVDRGDVDLRPENVPVGRMSIRTKSGNVELALPSAARFAMLANTHNGEIDNQFSDALKENSEGHGAKLEGSVGSGPDINISTEHGTITVRKASGEKQIPDKAI